MQVYAGVIISLLSILRAFNIVYNPDLPYACGMTSVIAGNWHKTHTWTVGEVVEIPAVGPAILPNLPPTKDTELEGLRQKTPCRLSAVQCGALVPTGWDNPGLEGYGSLWFWDISEKRSLSPHTPLQNHDWQGQVRSDSDLSCWRREEIPGPRFIKDFRYHGHPAIYLHAAEKHLLYGRAVTSSEDEKNTIKALIPEKLKDRIRLQFIPPEAAEQIDIDQAKPDLSIQSIMSSIATYVDTMQVTVRKEDIARKVKDLLVQAKGSK